MIEQIREKWTLLKASALTEGDQLVQRRIFLQAPVQFYMVMEQGSQRRLFRYCVKEEFGNDFRTAITSPGLDIRSLRFVEQYGAGNAVIQLTLNDDRYQELFDVLLQDICERAIACDDAAIASSAIASRINEWLIFFTVNDPTGLSEERQRGLYGELSFLRKIADAGFLDEIGLVPWVGPVGADQDFQFRQTAVEVKVSLSAQNQELLVSSERQLSTTGYKHLYINHVSLSSRRDSGETLVNIVADVRARVPIACRVLLEQLLFQAGYLDIHSERYSQSGFVVREENYFEVSSGFPRITENLLPQGVGKVKYAISVPVCKQFAVDENAVLKAIRAEYDDTN